MVEVGDLLAGCLLHEGNHAACGIQESQDEVAGHDPGEKIRKEHCKKELYDLVEQIKELEFGIAWINRYIPLLREVIRTKGD